MKIIIFILVILPLYAGQVPVSWMSEVSPRKKLQLDELSLSFNGVLDLQESIMNQSSHFSKNLSKRNWSLQGQKTDLAVSRSGLFGFSAVKGTSAVELSWGKKGIKEKDNKEKNNDIHLDTSMSELSVLKAVKPFYKILLKNNQRSEYSRKIKNFEGYILRYHRALKSISPLIHRQFVPSKFRLDLTNSYNSPLFGMSNLSGDIRIRLEWKISRSIKSMKNNFHIQDQETVKKLILDLGNSLANINDPKGYRLKQIGVGLGISKDNLLGFSKIKGGATGILFFTKTKKSIVDYIDSQSKLSGQYSWPKGEQSKLLNGFTRVKFRKGIKRSFNISRWFNQFLSKRNFSKWEVKKIKTSFSISYKGFLGLADISSKSLISFTFIK